MAQTKQLIKVCKTCTTEKPRELFPVYHSGPKAGQLRSASCITCDNSISNARKAISRGNPDYQARGFYRIPEGHVTRRDQNRNYIAGVLKGAKCMDCPETRVITLQFDHRDPQTKLFSINESIKGGGGKISLSDLKAEVTKCDIVCANCHLVRTAGQFGNWRLGL